MKKYTIKDFDRDFPDDNACLEWLKNARWPLGIQCVKCQRVTKHHKVHGRSAYACDNCGNHVYPMAGTILEHSSTPLRLWFHAMYLMGSTRCGISAKTLERELGVTYKTAWRMFHQIRTMLSEDTLKLLNEVEIDETYVGGKRRGGDYVGRSIANKTPVFGMAERKGKVVAKVVPNVQKATVLPIIKEKILPSTMIYSDEFQVYNTLPNRRFKMVTSNRAWEEETRKYLTEVRSELNSIERQLNELMAKRESLVHEADAYETALQSYLNRTGRQEPSSSESSFKGLLATQKNMKDKLKRIAERENGVIKVGPAADILFNFGLTQAKTRDNTYRVVYGILLEMEKKDKTVKKIAPSTFKLIGSQERLPNVIVGKPTGVYKLVEMDNRLSRAD